MPDGKITKLSEFIEKVRDDRESWGTKPFKELWFRGESKKHASDLRPKLYRPRENKALKSIPDILEIENRLYEEFQHCGVQLCDQRIEGEEWDWDWYFLMQHHGAPTRLLDWSDGALIALHFAVQNKHLGDTEDAFVYVLEPDRLKDHLETIPETNIAKQHWTAYAARHPYYKTKTDEWDTPTCPPIMKIATS